MSVHIHADPAALAGAAADHIAAFVTAAARDVTLGLAGGSTPAATYEQLAARDVDWSQVTIWLGDERWVPHDHPDSNTRMVRATLVDKVIGRFVAPNTAFGDPADAAESYAAQLEKIFYGGTPDLVLLGIGDDGHTASLFPGTDALTAEEGIYLANWVEAQDGWRLTASLPLLWSAREVVFLAQGESKAGVLSEIIEENYPYPAEQVAAGADVVHWMIDEAAASQLRSIPR
jgi:6-phosphogluconolactonase